MITLLDSDLNSATRGFLKVYCFKYPNSIYFRDKALFVSQIQKIAP